MTPGDWERIKQIFSAALSVPSPERDAYVRSACGDAADVLRAVSDLLRAHYDASKSFLEPRTIVFAAPWLFREGDRVASRFSIVKRIARGGMGEVYQVYDERLRLHVALKAIRPELIGDAETAERFRREVLVTRDIAHEGLCKVFDLVEHEVSGDSSLPAGTVIPCLTMQLLEGNTLQERLESSGPLSPSDAFPLVQQIADALQVLHAAGIVHRDLKPSNVMLVPMPEGTRAVLTDFGLAKPLDESIFETQANVQGGAPYFMAPELLKGHRPSHASDIYAFGLLIDEMVTSTRAFASESLHALMLQKLGEGPARPCSRAADLPGAWERAILRCLSPDPRHRLSTPRAVVAALSAPERWAPWQRWFPPHASSTAPRRWRLAGFTATTAAVLAVGVFLESPAQGTTPRSVVIGRFENLTSRRELDYLAAGTAGELARRLSRVPELRVYRNLDPAAPIRDADGPTFSLHGDIQEVNTTLRITVAVTDARRGNLLWSQRFDGPSERSLQLEDQLASDTVAALVRLYPAEEYGALTRASVFLTRMFVAPRPQVPASGTTNAMAFDAYLRGRVLFEERTVPTALQAIQYLKRAIELDPRFAAAYSTLADVHGVLMDLHYKPHNELIADAERYADQAVAIDPDLPEAQLTLAAVRQMQWRWEESDAAYRRAIELHPTFARAHRWHGGLLLQFGRFDESLALHRRALELDPYDFPSQSAYGHALFHAGRASEAAAHLERVLAQKDLFYAHNILGQAYAYLAGSQTAERDDFFRKALERSEILRAKEAAGVGSPGVTEYGDMVGALAWIYHGEPAGAAPYVARLEAGLVQGRVSPSVLARVYAAEGDAVRALDALHSAEAQRDRELYYVGVSPYYARIRNQPQFRALIERVRLTQK
jgi:tetratricopeptide (TPR) repeat protein/TolB-like protein/tRNA A-37 threonylcarbamoyl transferase component Bud32